MVNRKGLIGAAACAALAIAGFARADDLQVTRPVTLDEAPAGAATSDTPLMTALKKSSFGKTLAENNITMGARVEGSWTYSASSPPANVITGRLFDFENQDITLNQIGVYFDKAVDGSKFDIGGRMEWIYGGDARFIHSLGLFDHYDASPDNQWDLNQAYIDIGLGSGWKVRLGKMVTPFGYEVIDPTQNMLYSHSFMFDWAIPFTHTGACAYHTVNENVAYMFGISRGWDTSLEDNNGTIDYMASITITPNKKEKWVITAISGADQAGDNDNWRTLVEAIYEVKPNENLTIAIDGHYAYECNSHTSVAGSDAQWFGVAAYAKWKINDNVYGVGRVEYFNDQDGARLTGGVGGTSLYEATVGLQIVPFPTNDWGKGLTIRPEVRFDYSEKAFFDGGTDRYQVTAAIDAIYQF
jgi:hypothetical protein